MSTFVAIPSFPCIFRLTIILCFFFFTSVAATVCVNETIIYSFFFKEIYIYTAIFLKCCQKVKKFNTVLTFH